MTSWQGNVEGSLRDLLQVSRVTITMVELLWQRLDTELGEVRDAVLDVESRIGQLRERLDQVDELLTTDGGPSDLMTRAEVARAIARLHGASDAVLNRREEP